MGSYSSNDESDFFAFNNSRPEIYTQKVLNLCPVGKGGEWLYCTGIRFI